MLPSREAGGKLFDGGISAGGGGYSSSASGKTAAPGSVPWGGGAAATQSAFGASPPTFGATMSGGSAGGTSQYGQPKPATGFRANGFVFAQQPSFGTPTEPRFGVESMGGGGFAGLSTGYGSSPPTRNGFGSSPPISTGYGSSPPTRNGFGSSPPTRNGFGSSPPTRNGFGSSHPTSNGFGEPSNSSGFGSSWMSSYAQSSGAFGQTSAPFGSTTPVGSGGGVDVAKGGAKVSTEFNAEQALPFQSNSMPADKKEPVRSTRKETFFYALWSFSTGSGGIYSPDYRAGGFRWRLLVYPRGDNPLRLSSSEEGGEFVSVYLECRGPVEPADGASATSKSWSQSTSFKIIAVSRLPKLSNWEKECSHRFTKVNSSCGNREFAQRSLLLHPKFMLNDCITFSVEITLQDDQYDSMENTQELMKNEAANVAGNAKGTSNPPTVPISFFTTKNETGNAAGNAVGTNKPVKNGMENAAGNAVETNKPTKNGTRNAAGNAVGTSKPTKNGTANAAGNGLGTNKPTKNGTGNAVGTDKPTKNGTANAVGTNKQPKNGTANAVGTNKPTKNGTANTARNGVGTQKPSRDKPGNHAGNPVATTENDGGNNAGNAASSNTLAETFMALSQYGRDLTADARAKKLDPVTVRDEEIRRTVEILSRRTKNNPVLLVEPGVRKTAIMEGLSQRIVSDEVPPSIQGRCLIVLEPGALVAGTTQCGELEERLKAVLSEAAQAKGNVILFIDDIHTIMGLGQGEVAGDAGNLLKSMLACGELRCIGATTLKEYRTYIEKDAALESQFTPVLVGQLNVEDTVSILRGLKEKYEVHHGARVSDSALVAAAALSDRYVTDRFLPDKAIDLVDESMAKVKMEITCKPSSLDRLNRRILQLEMWRLSLTREDVGALSLTALVAVETALSDLRAEQRSLEERWEREKRAIEGSSGVGAETKQGMREAEDTEQVLVRNQVTEDDIASTVSAWTGIPVTKLLSTETQKLLGLEDALGKRVIGQKQAVKAVSEAVQRSRAGLSNPKRPIALFAFLGPTGVGKTELAKALSEQLFDRDDALIRLDMSEYMEKLSFSRLVGAAAGYVGYDDGGQLSDAVRRRPYSVVLFDEIEKAHPDAFNVLLQVLDDGRLADSHGHVVDFTNTVIILTSIVGSDAILSTSGDDSEYEEMRENVKSVMRGRFRPEFLNRVDEFIIFHALGQEEVEEIVDMQVAEVNKRIADKKLTVRLTDEAKKLLVKLGYNPLYGARRLKRAVQKELETSVAKGILEGRFRSGDIIDATAREDAVELDVQRDVSSPKS